MPLPNPDIFGPATLSMGQSISAFQAFLPKFTEVRKADPQNDPAFAADVRMGEVAAVVVTMGVGAIASSLTGSPAPLYTGLFMCLVLVFLYESALRAERPFEPKPGRESLTNGS